MRAPRNCNAYDSEPWIHGKGNKNEVGYTTKGWLNIYSYYCGYSEQIHYQDMVLKLWLEGDYHVLCFDHSNNQRLFWESFDDAASARIFFAEKAKELFPN